MGDTVIKIENLSKKYVIGKQQSGSLRETLANTFGMAKTQTEEFWALRNINLEIKQGEVVGIIGRNGAGKSTLLKLLSKITYPTSGKITLNGRVSSLLEVGTGFHAELTGRENIFLNGTILGMNKKEIKSKFDEIVDFSGIEKFLDTPVKRYSSGMYVRLAFAVAAHLEPEILIIDEVLAVGDAEFQKKCLGKMDEVAKGGRTVIFVSHNMGAVKSLCNRGVLLNEGRIEAIKNDISSIVSLYSQAGEISNNKIEFAKNRKGNQDVIFSDFYILDKKNEKVETLLTGEDYNFCFVLKTNKRKIKDLDVDFSIHETDDTPLTVNQSSYYNKTYSFTETGEYCVKFHIPSFYLSPGNKQVRGLLTIKKEIIDWPEFVIGSFNVIMGDFYKSGNLNYNKSIKCLLHGEWEN